MFKYLHHLCEPNPSAVNGVTLTLVVFVIPLLFISNVKRLLLSATHDGHVRKKHLTDPVSYFCFSFFLKNILSSVVSSRLLIQAEQTKLQCVTKLHIVQATVVQYVPNC